MPVLSSHAILDRPVVQVLCPGLVVLLDKPMRMLGLVAIGVVFTVTLVAIRFTPHEWIENDAVRYQQAYKIFKKISVAFCFFVVRGHELLPSDFISKNCSARFCDCRVHAYPMVHCTLICP